MLTTAKSNPYTKPLHPAYVPLFARDISNPNSETINNLYRNLVEKSNGQNPDFWSRRTPFDYISFIFSAAGAMCTAFGFQNDNKTTKNLGIGIFLVSVGSFVYSIFNRVTLHAPKSVKDSAPTNTNKDASKSETIHPATKITVLDKETISDLIQTVRNSALDFNERERAYDKLHENLSATESLPNEYNFLLQDLQDFNSHRENQIETIQPRLERLTSNFKIHLGNSDLEKERFARNFSEIITFINNKEFPTTCRSEMLRTTIKLIRENWREINSVSTCVQEVFNCLFKWIEESPKYPSGNDEMPIMLLTKAMERVADLAKEIKRNLNISGHDYSKYDDFILNLEPFLKSDNLNLQEAARSIYKHTNHPLGVKPLLESLRTFNPKSRVSISEHRNKIELIVKGILENIGITVGSDPLQKIEGALKKDLFDYLNDSNNDILIVTSKLVNPSDERVCRKLVSLLDKEDIVLKITLIDVLSSHSGNPIVKSKLDSLLNDSSQNPFIRYNIAEILESTDIDRISLLIDSLKSDDHDIVNFAASRLEGVNDTRIIEPLISACKNGSIDAFFTLYTTNTYTTEHGFNISSFIQEELPKLLEEKKYAPNHINRARANKILSSFNTSPVVEIAKSH